MDEFGIGFQRSVIRLCMIDDAFAAKAAEHVDSGFFTTEPLGWLFKLAREYFREYLGAVTEVVIHDALRALSVDRSARYTPEVQAVLAMGEVRDEAWIKKRLEDFCKENLFAGAHRESAALWERGERAEAMKVMERAHERINSLKFDSVDRQWFFEELQHRQRHRVRDSMLAGERVFTTGIRELDARTDGGVKLGEVWAMLAYAKRCKTTWLINQAFNSTRVHRQPTVVFNLEGKGAQWAAKLDACFSAELYSNVKRGDITPALFREMHAEYLALRKLLVIRTLNDWDVNVLHLEAELAVLRAQGFRPRMAILDYMDLLRARDRVEGETAQQVAAARDFKRLCLKHDLAAWSAWQAQRPKPGAHTKEHVLTSANVADAYAKVRIVDAWGSLNATDEEMRKGEMRVHMEGHRDAPVGITYWITNDLGRMRMVTSSGTAPPPGAS